MLEFDLVGNHVRLTESDGSLLLSAAEADSGSSIGSRDLATRLRALAGLEAPARRRRLSFTRPESRALQRIIEQRIVTDELQELRAALADLLSAQS
jgi:hypothetical protein